MTAWRQAGHWLVSDARLGRRPGSAGARMAGGRGVITAQCKHSQANIMIMCIY